VIDGRVGQIADSHVGTEQSFWSVVQRTLAQLVVTYVGQPASTTVHGLVVVDQIVAESVTAVVHTTRVSVGSVRASEAAVVVQRVVVHWVPVVVGVVVGGLEESPPPAQAPNVKAMIAGRTVAWIRMVVYLSRSRASRRSAKWR
jgi:hypothetical protein